MALSEFLESAKKKAVTGILINIENAAYLASKKGFNVTEIVSSFLSNATFDKQLTQQVFIQSDDSVVLSVFKRIPTYKKVLTIEENIEAFRNEYTTIPFGFFSNPIMEIATYVSGIGVDGLETEYPATASAYLRSSCSRPESEVPPIVAPGALMSSIPTDVLPPVEAPSPLLEPVDVLDPPLPSILMTQKQHLQLYLLVLLAKVVRQQMLQV
ncbi:hypothetical protein GIB67_036925 [Kingdonia uniflora]|uniref:glycerophosphodiester phosphodiesterase n=1 Tax=Kingdonia uniflora TaxID=39325 RepID=A0A7J7NVN8_9MAGN|nr:hypothetical protein GIB67_036925 [Kingdonia uniflora]